MKTLPLSEVKMKLSELVDQVDRRDEAITITKNGTPKAMLLSTDEYEGLKETLAILSNKELMKEIRRGIKALKNSKKRYTLDEIFDSGKPNS